jgi:hypothetical protein
MIYNHGFSLLLLVYLTDALGLFIKLIADSIVLQNTQGAPLY